MNKGGSNCVTCGKKCLSLLEGLNDNELALLEEKRTVVSYHAGETIYKEGLLPHGLLCLSKGKAKITKRSHDDGKELIVELKKPVDFIGFTELLTHKRYETNAVALEDSAVCVIDQNDFFKVLGGNNAFASRINLYFAEELSRMQNKIISLTQKNLDARLAEALLEYCNLYGVNKNDEVSIHTLLRRDDLAALAGMTASSVSRTLTVFEKEGIIEVQGRRIKILDKKKLEEISSSDSQQASS
ncbi:MAG: Crp/Fnr family transcriptional regulator [Bacteroidetes bacterium]|nr:Crp/Fnr family transcriptional regulator [Bacteroidota bacterium]